jgi:hypothetical protein
MEIRLTPWQNSVWDNPARFKIINTGRRTGKTTVSVVKMLYEASFGNKRIWYIAPTYRQAKQIAWELLKEYTPGKAKAQFNETELKSTWNNGSTIELKGADNPESLRGTYIDFLIMDEVAFIPNWSTVWEAVRPLLTDKVSSAWFISTPNGLNHFHDLYQMQNKDSDYKSFHFTSYDNPHLKTEEIEKAKKEMDENSFKQEYMADFVRPKGTVYSEWPLNNFRSVPYDTMLPVHITMDFGVNDPTSIIWIQPQGSEFRIIDYYEASDANIDHFISVIKSKPYREASLYTGDDAGRARTLTTGTSVIDELSKNGIYVRTTSGLRIPDQIRITHKNIKSLFVDNKLTRFRDCLLNYRYPEIKDSARNQENEVPIHDEYSHAMRALEYYFVNYKPEMPIYTPVRKNWSMQ